MKAFKKSVLAVVISITSLLLFSIPVFAAENNENVSPMQDENVPVFAGFDATPRDCKEVNVRELPNDSSNIISKIPLGETFKVFEQSGKWFRVEYQGLSGFVFWKYISLIEEEITGDSNLIGNSIIQYTSSENRDFNIALACNAINGVVLQPGEEFRWSKIVGQASAEKGYLPAPVIINRKSVTGYGGGVCQVSTTLYNAILDTPIVPIEHHHHSIGSAYAKNDATVAYGSKDFAFNNTYDFPIRIEASSYYSVVFVNLYREDMSENTGEITN